MDNQRLYTLIYALAACNGRDAALFGPSAPCAQEAFARGLCDDIFPELWFELPLMGDPWFDLHMLVARKDMHEGVRFAGLGGPYADALSWFAQSEDTRQLALSFDTGKGNAQEPALQLLLDRRSMSAAQAFLGAAGHEESFDSYRAFIHSMPSEWYACYLGLFPARTDANWVRVECILNRDAQRAYAHDAELLRSQLAQVGMSATSDVLVNQIQELARSPLPLEFQFNVGADGQALSTMSASLRFQPEHWRNPGEIAEPLFRRVYGWGLADERCALLAKTVFSKRATKGDESSRLWCFPAFVKLRWTDGVPVDAKTYLMAGVDQGQ
ncbi:MAG: hypothetical protein Q4B54_08245 [Coriobacteriales bacterium]|nr:hypothetical protein [Coriobacteriales bacterium]